MKGKRTKTVSGDWKDPSTEVWAKELCQRPYARWPVHPDQEWWERILFYICRELCRIPGIWKTENFISMTYHCGSDQPPRSPMHRTDFEQNEIEFYGGLSPTVVPEKLDS